jgi:diguanylate cyclase (GGDEF)-like protein/PAS domain S-box-containing protein
MPLSAATLTRQLQALRDHNPELVLIIGGQGVPAVLRKSAGVLYAADTEQLAELANTALTTAPAQAANLEFERSIPRPRRKQSVVRRGIQVADGQPPRGEGWPDALGPEAYRAMYENSPDGVLFTAPDGRVLAANPAACEIFGRTEAQIRAIGRQGMADDTDERWGPMLTERARTGRVQGIARMICGDGAVIEVEMSARMFTEANGAKRTCTIVRDVTERVAMERQRVELSERLRELTLTDELTGLRNRRGFVVVGSQLLELADRESATVDLLFLDIDNLKDLNDRYGHNAGDAALRAVGRTLGEVLRRADVAARVGGDEFVVLALGLEESDRQVIAQRIQADLCAADTAAVSRRVAVSMGWAGRTPRESKLVEDLLREADSAMYQTKASKGRGRGRAPTVQ